MIVNCKTCGIEFDKYPSDIRRGKGNHYCSKKCHQALRKCYTKGKNKLCLQCNREFYVHPGRLKIAKYCSKKCKYMGPRTAKKTCVACGHVFKPNGSERAKLYCSVLCRSKHKVKGERKNCNICGKVFYVPKSKIAARGCSAECNNKWQGRNKVTIACKVCKVEFKVSPSTLANGRKYCSIKCRDKDPARREHIMKIIAAQQTESPNKFEKLGYSILDDLGVDYIPQHLIGNKFCVDAFIPSVNIVLQFDGDYWHGNLEKFPTPDKRQTKRMKLDISQDAYMAKCGYTVVRIWQSELNKDNKVIRDRLGKIFVASLSPQLNQLSIFE